jgi:hypothetical protein
MSRYVKKGRPKSMPHGLREREYASVPCGKCGREFKLNGLQQHELYCISSSSDQRKASGGVIFGSSNRLSRYNPQL